MDGRDDKDSVSAELAAERMLLEREALAVERERLIAARAHAEQEASLARARRSPMLAAAAMALLAALCFAGGMLTGMSVMEGRQQRLREARLAQALSKLNISPDAVTTNTSTLHGASGGKAHRDVAVVVIQ